MKPKKKFNKQDHRALALWAAGCAECELPLFEKKHPKDKRPRKAILAVRAWVAGEITVSEARVAALAAHAAARDSNDPAAIAAARAAGHAVATAHVPGHAPHAAAYAVKAAALGAGNFKQIDTQTPAIAGAQTVQIRTNRTQTFLKAVCEYSCLPPCLPAGRAGRCGYLCRL